MKTSTQPASNRTAGNHSRTVYPFGGIVGQEEMKLSLMLNVIDPAIGGVMIMGHRGTGKSTAVRALADLLPPIVKVKGCLYGCDPDNTTELCRDCAVRLAAQERLPRERGPGAGGGSSRSARRKTASAARSTSNAH